MARFSVRKNTLPYVHQWAIIDKSTGSKVGEYKTKKLAEMACDYFEKHGLDADHDFSPPEIESAWRSATKRMREPDGDSQPKFKPKHSNKRRVELD